LWLNPGGFLRTPKYIALTITWTASCDMMVDKITYEMSRAALVDNFNLQRSKYYAGTQ